jgi:hypothetical protein
MCKQPVDNPTPRLKAGPIDGHYVDANLQAGEISSDVLGAIAVTGPNGRTSSNEGVACVAGSGGTANAGRYGVAVTFSGGTSIVGASGVAACREGDCFGAGSSIAIAKDGGSAAAGRGGIAIANAENGQVGGDVGCLLVLTNRGDCPDGIDTMITGLVGKHGIQAGFYYTLSADKRALVSTGKKIEWPSELPGSACETSE